ncbi:MAG: hypothetical protein A3F72_14600 [Bacteroidetes bacterium RIFCSPLOWO2_12_FULL_35_15]|nr:MAG: hypothetical protein A3F72_14600 [Bacteroidetes bacterium RIFCSPLOWO2_12_FULL_35_15]
MADLKKYKKNYVVLFVIILLAFLFIFINLATINTTYKDVSREINLLYFFNSVLIISFSLFYFIFIGLKRKEIQVVQSNMNDTSSPISDKEEVIKERNEIYENELKNKLSHLENTLSSEKTKEKMLEAFLNILVQKTDSVQAALFLTAEKEDKKILRFSHGYAFYVPEDDLLEFQFGEGLSGQVAIDKKLINLYEIKVDRMPVYSGMGSSVPQNLLICPLLNNNVTLGVVELASFRKYELQDEQFIEKASSLVGSLLGKTTNTI